MNCIVRDAEVTPNAFSVETIGGKGKTLFLKFNSAFDVEAWKGALQSSF